MAETKTMLKSPVLSEVIEITSRKHHTSASASKREEWLARHAASFGPDAAKEIQFLLSQLEKARQSVVVRDIDKTEVVDNADYLVVSSTGRMTYGKSQYGRFVPHIPDGSFLWDDPDADIARVVQVDAKKPAG